MPYGIAISGPKNLLLPDKMAHSSQPLRMQQQFKRDDGKMLLAMMDCPFVLTCPCPPGY